MTHVAVARSKFARGFRAGRENAPLAYSVVELTSALTRVYPTEAHLVAYVVEGAERQPRVNKSGLALFDRPLFVECLLCDVDNPEHAEWDDQSFAAAREQDARLPTLVTAGIYYTKRGRRVVQPLSAPLPIEVVEAHLASWLLALEREGLAVDWACRDWTRHYLLPNVRRDGKPWRSRCIDLSQMRPIEPPVVVTATPTPERPLPHPRNAPRPVVHAWSETLPERWRHEAQHIAPALRSIPNEWHSPFLALAGAVLSRGLPPEHLPAFCGAVSVLTEVDTRTDDRVQLARSTAERWQQRLPIVGYTTLRARWPVLADAVDEAFASSAELRLRAQSRSRMSEASPAARSTVEVAATLEQTIATAPPGLTLIKAECGLGKTQAALRVAATRAAKTHASAKATGERAPDGSRTSISVDKNSLAIQCRWELSKLDTSSARIFGPLSLRDGEGEPVCKLHSIAEPLVAGGLRMQWELCERRGSEEKCPHYEGCAARLGLEGDDPSRVLLGPHALLGELDGAAGMTGLLVIDEPPELLETKRYTAEALDLAHRQALRWFDGVFVGAMLPALSAFSLLLREALGTAPLDACDAVRRVQDKVPQEEIEQARRSSGVSEGDVVDCAAGAVFPNRHHGTSPPLLRVALDGIVGGFHSPHEIGMVAGVLKAVHHALASEYPVTLRRDDRAGKPALLVTAPREQLAQALRRDGAVVVADANVDLHAPVLARIVGYEPPLHRFEVGDGAPIERTLVRTRKATRKEWLKNGRLVLTQSLSFAVKQLIDWALETPGEGPLGIITFAALEVALRFAAGLDESEQASKAWKSMGQPKQALEALSAELAPILTRWPRRLLTGHYGATRGLNTLADCDALATLGDPWMNLDAARSDAAFLGLGDNWEKRYEERCRAELEQAHGRLRTVHRTRSGRALHVGSVLPGGRGWETGDVRFEKFEGGRLPTPPAADPSLVAAAINAVGSVSELARRLGCDRKAVRRYRDGQTPVPERVATILEPLAGSAGPWEGGT